MTVFSNYFHICHSNFITRFVEKGYRQNIENREIDRYWNIKTFCVLPKFYLFVLGSLSNQEEKISHQKTIYRYLGTILHNTASIDVCFLGVPQLDCQSFTIIITGKRIPKKNVGDFTSKSKQKVLMNTICIIKFICCRQRANYSRKNVTYQRCAYQIAYLVSVIRIRTTYNFYICTIFVTQREITASPFYYDLYCHMFCSEIGLLFIFYLFFYFLMVLFGLFV